MSDRVLLTRLSADSFHVNRRAAYGLLDTGNGPANLLRLMAHLDVPLGPKQVKKEKWVSAAAWVWVLNSNSLKWVAWAWAA